jgi:hypothetical protein
MEILVRLLHNLTKITTGDEKALDELGGFYSGITIINDN